LKRNLLLVLVISIVFSCSKESDFPYSKGINLYLNETFNLDIEDHNNETLVFLYLEYCRSCITDALVLIDTMSVVSKEVKLFFIGDENAYPENQIRIQSLKRKYNFEMDPNSNHYSFSSGINEPLILKVGTGYIVDFAYINDSSFDNSRNLIAGSE